MEYPNIELIVKHDTSTEGKVFSEGAYKAMREQLSKLIRIPFTNRVKDVWCDNKDHHGHLTKIVIDADTKKYDITEVCCNNYERTLDIALSDVEKEI